MVLAVRIASLKMMYCDILNPMVPYNDINDIILDEEHVSLKALSNVWSTPPRTSCSVTVGYTELKSFFACISCRLFVFLRLWTEQTCYSLTTWNSVDVRAWWTIFGNESERGRASSGGDPKIYFLARSIQISSLTVDEWPSLLPVVLLSSSAVGYSRNVELWLLSSTPNFPRLKSCAGKLCHEDNQKISVIIVYLSSSNLTHNIRLLTYIPFGHWIIFKILRIEKQVAIASKSASHHRNPSRSIYLHWPISVIIHL